MQDVALAVPKGHPLIKLKRSGLRHLRTRRGCGSQGRRKPGNLRPAGARMLSRRLEVTRALFRRPVTGRQIPKSSGRTPSPPDSRSSALDSAAFYQKNCVLIMKNHQLFMLRRNRLPATKQGRLLARHTARTQNYAGLISTETKERSYAAASADLDESLTHVPFEIIVRNGHDEDLLGCLLPQSPH